MTATLEATQKPRPLLAIDPAHTSVEFAVKPLMISNVKGRFSDVTGTLEANADDLASGALQVSVAIASVDTRQEQRDAHLRSPDFFDAEQWPTMQFTGKRVEGDIKDEFRLIGDLTIRDTTRELALAVTNEGTIKDPWGNDRIGFSARERSTDVTLAFPYNQYFEAGGFVSATRSRSASTLSSARRPSSIWKIGRNGNSCTRATVAFREGLRTHDRFAPFVRCPPQPRGTPVTFSAFPHSTTTVQRVFCVTAK